MVPVALLDCHSSASIWGGNAISDKIKIVVVMRIISAGELYYIRSITLSSTTE